MLFQSPLAHPTVIIRKSMFDELNIEYDTNFVIGEDYELWSRCSEYFSLANIPEVLLKYRILKDSLYRSHKDSYLSVYCRIYKRQLKLLNIKLDEKDCAYFRAIISQTFSQINLNWDFFEKANQLLHTIYDANRNKQVFIEPYFSEQLATRWFWTCYRCKRLGYRIFKVYKKSKLRKYVKVSWSLRFKFRILAFFYQMKNLKKR